jgi:ABC-type Fe3+ transport system substrate-binding protein
LTKPSCGGKIAIAAVAPIGGIMKTVYVLIGLCVFILGAASAFAQEAKLVEAAKKEGGRVVVYGSLEADTADAVRKAFEKKTGLGMDYWRSSTTKVVERASSEYRAKKALVDVILVHYAEMRYLFREKIVTRYNSPMFKEFTKESIDPELGPPGEAALGVSYVKFSYLFGQKGAPVDYMRAEKMSGEGSFIMLAAQPPHPNAGKAFMDFFLDNENMKILAANAEFVTRKGVHPPIPDAEKIKFIEMDHLDEAGFAEKKKEYQKLFLQ